MSPSTTILDELDHDISIAYIALGVARSAWARCPSGENERLIGDAEAAVNRLLEERFAAQQ
jgi:hypothetical protein